MGNTTSGQSSDDVRYHPINRKPLSITEEPEQPVVFDGSDVERMEKQRDLQVEMCRYESGKLVKSLVSVSNGNYIAVSHVWGESEWRVIPGVEDCTAEKAVVIKEQLPLLMGSKMFWMDVLCINQNDKNATIAITQHIPAIFRGAEKRLVVRDSTGIQECQCVKHFGTARNALEGKVIDIERMKAHQKVHQNESLYEGVFSRLWVLQEMMLRLSVCPLSPG